MKSTAKSLLFVALFCSTVFADGNMGSGGKTCTSNCFVEPQTVEETTKENADQKQSDGSILDYVTEYLFSLMG